MIRPGVYRVRGDKLGYSRISDTFARDSELSMRARSVGLFMLSHRDGFVMQQEAIARRLKISRNTLRGAFEDLAERGYMRSGTIRDGQRIAGTWYMIHDEHLTTEQWDEEVAQIVDQGERSLWSKSESSEEHPSAAEDVGPESADPDGSESEGSGPEGSGSEQHKGYQCLKGDHHDKGDHHSKVNRGCSSVDQSDRLGIRARGSEATTGRQRAREPDDHGETRAVIDTLRTRTGTAIDDLHHVKLIIKQLLGDRADVKDRVAYLIGAIRADDNPYRFLPTPTPPRFQRSNA